jgi:uncharacterized protein (DUF1778 family)
VRKRTPSTERTARLECRVPELTKDTAENAAQARGESVTAFVCRAIVETAARDRVHDRAEKTRNDLNAMLAEWRESARKKGLQFDPQPQEDTEE